LRLCSKCKEHIDASMFGAAKQMPDGIDCWCKQCRREYMRAYMRSYVNEKKRDADRSRCRKEVELITDRYVRRVISRHCGVHTSHIPSALVEAQRIHIMILRETRK
jgi:hypothetical protein